MPTVYTRRIANIVGSAGGDSVLYVVPASTQVVLRDLVASVFSLARAGSFLSFYVVTGVGNLHIGYLRFAEIGTTHLDIRVGMNPGETLRVATDYLQWTAGVTAYVFPS